MSTIITPAERVAIIADSNARVIRRCAAQAAARV